MALNIDTDFNFTSDCKYWESYNKGHSDTDPDTYSPRLRLYQQILYSRKTPSGKTLNLTQGKDKKYDYLIYDNIRFGSDNIINMCERYDLSWSREANIDNYDEKIKNYILKSYTLGGEIIFPKHKNSLNVMRGRNHKIKDRFDLTLECIRRFYEDNTSPLYNILKTDEQFFKLFGKGHEGFKAYVDFFFLNDLVKDDYTKIKLFFGDEKDVFIRNPLPQNKTEWDQLLKNQMIFLEKRNQRIKNFVTD